MFDVLAVTICFSIDFGVLVFPIPFPAELFTTQASSSNSIPSVAIQETFAVIPDVALVAA